jgi:hypothetical protein
MFPPGASGPLGVKLNLRIPAALSFAEYKKVLSLQVTVIKNTERRAIGRNSLLFFFSVEHVRITKESRWNGLMQHCTEYHMAGKDSA